MSEQDKRPVYMGTFERQKKEINVRLDDIIIQVASIKRSLMYAIFLASLALGTAIVSIIAIY